MIRISSFTLARDERAHGVHVLGEFDVQIGDIIIGGCQLVLGLERDQVFVWFPAMASRAKSARRWVKVMNYDLRKGIAQAAYDAYIALGGERRGTVGERRRHDVAERHHGNPADEFAASEGLRRTLRIEADEAARACG